VSHGKEPRPRPGVPQAHGGGAGPGEPAVRSGGRLLPRLSAFNVVEGSVRLAAQAFITALPLLITVAAFAPEGCRTC